MRNIKFRGKRKDTGVWVYGNLSIEYEGTCLISYWESQCTDASVNLWEPVEIWHEVMPETVGQYIGLKGYKGDYEDRRNNEVELFEGDVVEAMSEGSKGVFTIKWRQESSPCFILFPAWQSKIMWSIHGDNVGRKDGDYYDDLKRIGNIHDNPELNPAKGAVNYNMNNNFDPGAKAEEAKDLQPASEAANAQESAEQDKATGADSEEGTPEG